MTLERWSEPTHVHGFGSGNRRLITTRAQPQAVYEVDSKAGLYSVIYNGRTDLARLHAEDREEFYLHRASSYPQLAAWTATRSFGGCTSDTVGPPEGS